MRLCFRISSLVVVVSLILASVVPSQAKPRDFLFSKKFHGIVSIGASAWFMKEAFDARKDANDNFDLYKQAISASKAQELYDESRRKDTRSAAMLGLGLGTLALSIHLLLSGNEEELAPAKTKSGLVELKGVAFDLAGDPLGRRVRVNLKRGF
jgi:hypothetical protein